MGARLARVVRVAPGFRGDGVAPAQPALLQGRLRRVCPRSGPGPVVDQLLGTISRGGQKGFRISGDSQGHAGIGTMTRLPYVFPEALFGPWNSHGGNRRSNPSGP